MKNKMTAPKLPTEPSDNRHGAFANTAEWITYSRALRSQLTAALALLAERKGEIKRLKGDKQC